MIFFNFVLTFVPIGSAHPWDCENRNDQGQDDNPDPTSYSIWAIHAHIVQIVLNIKIVSIS
jgi:hypothetical protein